MNDGYRRVIRARRLAAEGADEIATLRAKLAEAERERDEARDSDRESLEMYRRCRDERDALRSRVESQAEELGRRSDHADGLEHERDAARRERDALAAKLDRVREWAVCSVCGAPVTESCDATCPNRGEDRI